MNKLITIAARRSQGLILLLCCVFGLRAAEVLPPPPQHHFNDYANVVSLPTAQALDRTLDQFEKTDSTQLVIAIFSKLPPNAVLEDYTVRIFKSWGVGTQKDRNGAILFVFVNDHKLRIEVGYGLEGVLPDITCKRIIEDAIAPGLRAGNFDAAMTSGVNAMIQAVHGEYKGTGRTVGGNGRRKNNGFGLIIFIFIILSIISSALRGRGTTYGSYGRRRWGGGPFIGGWGGGGGGGSSGGGGGGWGGGFSGGGGS